MTRLDHIVDQNTCKRAAVDVWISQPARGFGIYVNPEHPRDFLRTGIVNPKKNQTQNPSGQVKGRLSWDQCNDLMLKLAIFRYLTLGALSNFAK